MHFGSPYHKALPDRLLAEITTAMKTLPDAELLDLLAAVQMEAEGRNLCA